MILALQSIISIAANEAETPGNARDITPGALHDVHVFDFAFQIGSGLEHLEEMGVSKCMLTMAGLDIMDILPTPFLHRLFTVTWLHEISSFVKGSY